MNKKLLLLTFFGILFFLGIGITVLFLFNGTNNSDSKKAIISNTGTNIVQEKNKKTQEELLKEEELKKQLDLKAINDAGLTGDTSKCDSITDNNLKINCIDNSYAAKAGIENNKDFCLKITELSAKNKCLDAFNFSQATKVNDSKMCDNITTIDLKVKCKAQTILNKVESNDFTGSVKDCDGLDSANKSYCQNTVKNKTDIAKITTAINSNDLSGCKAITNKELYSTCNDTLVLNTAIKNKDISLCSQIINAEKKQSCSNSLNKTNDVSSLKLIVATLDLKKCDSLSDEKIKITCKDTINLKLAMSKKDKGICNSIQTQETKTQCNQFFITLNSLK